MGDESSFKGILGFVLATAGFIILLGSSFNWAFTFFISLFGVTLSPLSNISIVGVIIALVLFVLGTKLIFDNETTLIRAMVAALGIMFVVAGAITIGNIELFPAGTIAGLIIVSLGLGLIGNAAPSVDVLTPFGDVIDGYRKLIGAG